jgi:hypothetical protein
MASATYEGSIAAAPQKSSVEKIAPNDVSSREMQGVLSIWTERRAGRLMPARDDVLPRAMSRYLPNISLVKVLASELDYEFRIVGNVHAQAYGTRDQGIRMSDVIARDAGFGHALKASFDAVVRKRAPVAYRGPVGLDVGPARFVWLETLFLPLGNTDETVDHLLNAGTYMPLNGAWPIDAAH